MFNSSLRDHWKQAFDDLSTVIQNRLDHFFSNDHRPEPTLSIQTPNLKYLSHQFTIEEYLVLLIALLPHVQPAFFDQIIQQKFPQGGDFPQLGGMRGKQFRGFLPTGETVLFILAGTDLEKRFETSKLFHETHFFAKNHILWLEEAVVGEPKMSGKLVLSPETLDFMIYGQLT